MIDEKTKEKIFKADISNVVRKVKAGKPLSAAERKLIESTTKPTETPAGKRKFPIFESIGHAASTIGAPIALIKSAKRNGCKAFLPGNRVDSEILLPFLFGMLTTASNLPSGFSSWKEVLESERAKREGIKRQQDEKCVMPTDEAKRQAGEAWAWVFAELERAERELPPSLAGGTAVDIGKRLHSFTETVRRTAKEKFEKVGE